MMENIMIIMDVPVCKTCEPHPSTSDSVSPPLTLCNIYILLAYLLMSLCVRSVWAVRNGQICCRWWCWLYIYIYMAMTMMIKMTVTGHVW